jgi:hypothetical protein
MRRRFVAGLATAALAVGGTTPAAAQDARVYKPAGQWALDYGDDYCRLSRSFNDGENDLALAFERIQPGPVMNMVLVGDGIRTFRRADELGWSFAPGQGERKARYAQSKTAEGKDYYNFGPVSIAPLGPPAPGTPPGLPPAYDRKAEQAAARPYTAITLGSGLLAPVRIETGSLEAPVGALQACADDLARTWGIDPVNLAVGSEPAIPEGGGVGWLPQGTIPFEEFGKFAGGANQVRLMVDDAGKPTSCHIHWPTLSDALNKKVCSTLMAKATFTPAKGPDGQPTAGLWVGNPLFLGPPPPGGRRGG